MQPQRRRRPDADSPDWAAAADPSHAHDSAAGNAEAAAILDLQERAGNRSVIEMLAGGGPAALRASVQRDASDPPGDVAGPAGGQAVAEDVKPVTSTLVIASFDLAIPLDSFSFGGSRTSGASSASRPEVRRANVTFTLDAADPRLNAAVAAGTIIPTMVLSAPGLSWTLTDVAISALSIGPNGVSMTLDFASAEPHR